MPAEFAAMLPVSLHIMILRRRNLEKILYGCYNYPAHTSVFIIIQFIEKDEIIIICCIFRRYTHTLIHSITKTENVSMSDRWSKVGPDEDVRCRCWWAFFPLKSQQSFDLPATRLMAAGWWLEWNLIMHFSDAGRANILSRTDIDSLLVLRWFPEDARVRQDG